MNLCIDYNWGVGFFLSVFFRSRGQTLLAASLTVSRAPVQDDDDVGDDDDDDDDDDDVSNDGNEEVQMTFSAESQIRQEMTKGGATKKKEDLHNYFLDIKKYLMLDCPPRECLAVQC